jgi:hypothetical protein
MSARRPSFLRPGPVAAAPPLRARLLPWLLVLLLAALLVLQVLLADRHRLAADAQWRPLLLGLCGALGCDVPDWHQPQAFVVTARDIRPHPSAPGALLLSVSFRNDAHWPQAWPALELSLSDIDGQIAGQRRFAAEQYLGAVPATPWLAPGQSARATLEVMDPGQRAVSFQISFH